MQRNIFLATHPALNQLLRATSTFNSVMRTGLNIANAMNLTQIANNGLSATAATLAFEEAQARRELAIAIKKYGDDSIEAADAQEKLNIIIARGAENAIREAEQGFISLLQIVTSIGTAVATGILALSKYPRILATMARLGPALSNPFTAIPAIVLAAGGFITDFLKDTNEEFGAWDARNKEMLDNFFLVAIPGAVGVAGEFLANFFVNDLPNWAGIAWDMIKTGFLDLWNVVAQITASAFNSMIIGFESFVNGIIRAINKLISKFNKLPGANISKLSTVSLPRVSIPTIAAANGFQGDVTQPTLFLAGEAGREHVSISPNGSSGGNSSLIVHVHGSVIPERELFEKFDKYLANKLRSRNVRGF